MPALPKPNDTQFTLTPAGNHVAICYRVIDLGTQPINWQGQIKHQHKIQISWEIPDEKMEDGRPFTIGQRYTWSMAETANLRAMLESWRGKAFVETDFGEGGFDIKNLLGIGCMLNVVHTTKNGKTRDNIATVARLPKGVVVPPLTNHVQYLWLSKEEFSERVLLELSDNMQITIKNSPEYQELMHPGSTAPSTTHQVEPEFEDEIPF